MPNIVQDFQGFIWFATRDGLCRYDGNNLKIFQPDDSHGKSSLSFTALIKILLDKNGKIGILTEKGTIDTFDAVLETFDNISSKSFFQKYI